MKNFRFKGVLLAVLMSVALALGTTSSVYAGAEGGPDGSKIVGKSINAVLTAILITPVGETADPYVVQTIAGWCKKNFYVFGPEFAPDGKGVISPDYFDLIKAECSDLVSNCIEYYVLPSSGPPGYYSVDGREDLIITNVDNFINDGTVISAEITLQVLETK